MMLTAPPAPATDRCHQFSIGDIGVSLRSELPRAIDEFSELYESCRREGGVSGKLIHLEVRRGTRTLTGRRLYDVIGDGETLSTALLPGEVLPHLEWGINRRVIATRSEFVQLHAASLVSEGRGVIIAGTSGAGKSTLAAGLLARGWKYLSDEFALIHARTGLLHPFPRALSVKSGSFRIVERLGLPLFRERAYVRDFKGPIAFIRPSDIDDDVVAAPAAPRLVILPRFTGHPEVRSKEIPRARAAFRLAGQMLNRDVYDARAVPVLARVMKDATSHTLESGGLDAACDRIESLLRRTSLAVTSPCLCAARGGCGCGGRCGCC